VQTKERMSDQHTVCAAYADSEPTSLKAALGQGFWSWTAVGLGIIALAKGIREPNAWAYTQAQLDYSTGLIRRGFFGATLGHLLQLNLNGHFAVVSTALLLGLMLLLVLLARSSKLMERMPAGELLAVYASSYSVSYLAHLNGYSDIPLALLCVGTLFMRRTGWRLAAAICATVIGILIHEQFFFAFLPLLAISVLFGAATGKTAAERRMACIGGALLFVLGLCMVTYFARHAAVSDAQIQQLKQSMAGKADQPLDPELFKVMAFSQQKNMDTMMSVWRRPTYLLGQVEGLLLFAPTAAVLSWATLLLLRRWMPEKHRWLYAGVLLAMLAPLSLHLVGWDKYRWDELVCLNAFLMLLLVSRLAGGVTIQLPMRLRQACLLVMLLNMASGGGMLDDRHIRPFPFMRSPDAVVTSAAIPYR